MSDELIRKGAVQSALREYLATEDSLIAQEVERIVAALPAAAPVGVSAPWPNMDDVRDASDGGRGFWRDCSGCHDLNEGHPTGPFSRVLNCHLGFGCSKCGGLGAIWDTTNYAEMGDWLAKNDAALPAVTAPQGVEALEVIRQIAERQFVRTTPFEQSASFFQSALNEVRDMAWSFLAAQTAAALAPAQPAPTNGKEVMPVGQVVAQSRPDTSPRLTAGAQTAQPAPDAPSVIAQHGAEAVATAMILTIAETLRAKGKAVMTAEGDDFGAQVLEFADALKRGGA